VFIVDRFTYGVFYKPLKTSENFAWKVAKGNQKFCGLCQKGIGEIYLQVFFHFSFPLIFGLTAES